jgi:hypothetical protein
LPNLFWKRVWPKSPAPGIVDHDVHFIMWANGLLT